MIHPEVQNEVFLEMASMVHRSPKNKQLSREKLEELARKYVHAKHYADWMMFCQRYELGAFK